jgi:deazaflavin-dependent oxidoreductase (nitroreductase family)
MRVEHDDRDAAVASQGGAPTHPRWYHNFLADPLVEFQDGPHKWDMRTSGRGAERAEWWERAVAAFPPYVEYQLKTARQIPVLVLERADIRRLSCSFGLRPARHKRIASRKLPIMSIFAGFCPHQRALWAESLGCHGEGTLAARVSAAGPTRGEDRAFADARARSCGCA